VPDRPPAFLFDLDGTLCDTLLDIAASANHVRATFDLPAAELATVRAAIGDGARTMIRRVLADLRPDEPMLDEAMRRYGEHHLRQCTVHVTPYPGVREHLERLRAAGHALGVVTNKHERPSLAILRHLGLDELLPVVIGGDTLPVKKPDPAPLRHALERLGAAPDGGTIGGGTMVGDGLQDLRAGRAAGLRTIGCLFGYGDPDRLRAEGADEYWSRFGVPA
jgi:phosphoglycolate phosphatase